MTFLWESWDLFELEDALSPRSLHWYRNEDVTCRLEGIESLEGRSVARISIQWTWWGWTDLLAARDEDTWWDHFSTQGAVVELDMDCRGELLWDVEAGVFESFLLEAECEAELEVQAAGSGRWTAEAVEG